LPEKYTPVDKRHLFRGLKHKLEGSQEEIEKYETEIQSHLRDDASDHIAAAQAAQAGASKEKKDGLEGLGSKK
jgi:hypothetical protein